MTDQPKPTWEPLWLRCGVCRHDWDGWQPCHVPVPTYIAHIRALCCPKCGAKKVLLRMTPLSEAQVLVTMGVDETKGAEEGP